MQILVAIPLAFFLLSFLPCLGEGRWVMLVLGLAVGSVGLLGYSWVAYRQGWPLMSAYGLFVAAVCLYHLFWEIWR